MSASKICLKCGEDKPLGEYHKQSSAKDGLQGRCKDCAKALAREWYANNRERAAQTQKRWVENNIESVRVSRHKAKLRRKYQLSWDDYEEILADQDGKCWICGTTESGRSGSSRLSVDHCHTSGKVRGLLCNRCNNGLALFHDDVERMRAAISYLEASCLMTA